MQGFVRIACAVPTVTVGDVGQNTKEIVSKIKEAKEKGADIVAFPELSLSGYSCGDLFFQIPLICAANKALSKIAVLTAETGVTVLLGTPVMLDGSLYDTAAVISAGKITGLIPKTFLTASEKRCFSSGEDLAASSINSTQLGIKESYEIPVGNDLIFNLSNFVKIGAELGEDLFAPLPQSSLLALSGGEIIFNLSATAETVSSRENCKNAVLTQSGKCHLGYAFVSAGSTESTTDQVFSGQIVISERGRLLAENTKIATENDLIITDIDIDKIRADRLKSSIFKDCTRGFSARNIFVPDLEFKCDGSLSSISKTPFIPENKSERTKRCLDIFNTQVAGLKKRLSIVGSKAVIGISGGLDSTLALLVCTEAIKRLDAPPTNVYGITMPCFGTSDRTYNNSLKLMEALGITSKEINIKNACLNHFKDIGHDETKLDLTYENSQARERTQVLMDFAGEVGGIVVGTGDLSEMALGWCTYNGDHMSMYGVNSDIPKTLIPHIIESLIEWDIFPAAKDVLKDIIETPISPELLPPDKSGKIAQETESIVGPYILHDFFLYNIVRFGFSPSKVYELAKLAFSKDYSTETILKWLKNFYKRFFTQQFKRSCVPDGVKVGNVSLSPRGGFKMPSDASSALWLREVETLI